MSDGTEARPGTVGARLKEHRLIRGFTLRELGQRAHTSPSMLCQIEKGERSPSEQLLGSVARALSVSVAVLRGQPYIKQLQQDQLDAVIAPLSSTLSLWDAPPEQGDPPPRPLPTLEADVMEARRRRLDAEFLPLATTLPRLIRELAHAAETFTAPADIDRVRWLQAEVAHTAEVVAYRLGYMDLSRLALTRMEHAAIRGSDPRWVAVERVLRGQLALDGGLADAGMRLAELAVRDFPGGPELPTRAVLGTLHLKAAILASGRGDGDESNARLAEAKGIADELGETDSFGLGFGPFYVGLVGVSSAADRNEHDLAMQRALAVEVPESYPTVAHVARYWANRARAAVWTADHDDAMKSLQKAREVAPQQERYDPYVHEAVATMLRAQSRLSEELREYARWCGVG
ncbi:helix-turn-helix domain-containing protein [Streptomyces sp. 4503]|uniref:Helix-turn-helix domain-containing protein n=1 Tax=Streptomyces niphimycinicus TaxID=2842201 RepID=A0ABS6CJA4_9ACTN|nr:helix-turn-helix transcriptional regulator [Streptomyces niphimycinicus]MBU3867021.1 helix-turn-helix domain-containing protein [Streptomyces niphimycinicus]